MRPQLGMLQLMVMGPTARLRQPYFKLLPTKGAELELVLKRVKAEVIEATHNQQRPWTNSDLSTEVYLQPSN
jgi:hypothetical protein